jgi:hypothetical protein
MVVALPKNPQMFLHITGASGGWEAVSWSGRSRAIWKIPSLDVTETYKTKSLDIIERQRAFHRQAVKSKCLCRKCKPSLGLTRSLWKERKELLIKHNQEMQNTSFQT